MIKKILISFAAALSLVVSPVVTYANVSADIIQTQIENLSDSDKQLLKMSVDYSIYNKMINSDNDNYFSALSLNLGELSLENLLQIRVSLQGHVSDKPEYAPEIAANYIEWLECFGITGEDSDITYAPKDEDNIAGMYCDSLAVRYDNSTLKANRAVLFFMDSTTEDDEVDTRVTHALASFAALEYGKPIDFSKSETSLVMNETWKLYDKLQACTVDKEDELLNGELVEFYASEENSYYLISSDETGLAIATYK